MTPSLLTPQEVQKAATQFIEIAISILPTGIRHRTDGDEERFEHTSGLSINRKGRVWFVHSIGLGGITAIGLVQYLRGCRLELGDDDAGWDPTLGSKAAAERVLARAVTSHPAGEQYLLGRNVLAWLKERTHASTAQCGQRREETVNSIPPGALRSAHGANRNLAGKRYPLNNESSHAIQAADPLPASKGGNRAHRDCSLLHSCDESDWNKKTISHLRPQRKGPGTRLASSNAPSPATTAFRSRRRAAAHLAADGEK